MRFVIEFYRTRQEDDAHAMLGRVTCEAPDRESAIRMAGSLVHTLEMPQAPDAVSIRDDQGNELFRGAIKASD